MKKETTLYIEATTGVSGDMFVASLLDLGAPKDVLLNVLDSMPLKGFKAVISKSVRNSLAVCDFDVQLDNGKDNPDHDMDYLYGDKPSDDSDQHEHHEHRHMSDVRSILSKTDMTDTARALALNIFEILAQAEAKAHGVDVEDVHFHEVGAIDSIVDIISAAVCVDALNPDHVVISPLAEGTGTVRTQHGILPVPVPAVTNIALANGLKLKPTGRMGEFVTPTGAAIVAAIKTDDFLPTTYTIGKVGVGGGKRDYDPPSLLRAMWLQDAEIADENLVCRLETDIDDSTGEDLGHVMELLYNAGAREVHFSPIFMKKNRPAHELVVITTADLITKIERIIFEETTTIGIRRQWMQRTVLPRTESCIDTPYGKVSVKDITLPDGSIRRSPEYEDLHRIALEKSIPLNKIRSEIEDCIKEGK